MANQTLETVRIHPLLQPLWLLPCLVLGLLACSKSGDTPASADEILVGEYGALTGAMATFGLGNHKGVTMAVDAVNSAGGVLGKRIRIINEDTQGKPEEAQTVVTKLITKDRVVAVIGENTSSNSLAAAPVCQSRGIPMITPSATNPKVTEVGNYIFRVCFTDPYQGRVMAKFAASSLKLKDVAILRDVKSDYSVGLAGIFKENFTGMGGRIVGDEGYSQGDRDFTAQLTALKGGKPQALFIPGYYTDVGLIARQARKLGLNAVLLGTDGWESDKLWEVGGEALNGSFYSTHFSPDDPSPTIRKFVEDYRARYGSLPDANAVLAYDATMFLIDAIRRAGSARPDSIRGALEATKVFQGITGAITLDKNRNPIKPAVILEVKDGVRVFKEGVPP